MKTCISITNKLNKLGIAFETIDFTDTAISARTKDTSVAHNYHPENAIKTLIITTKTGMMAVILKGSDKIASQQLTATIGKWSIVQESTLSSKIGYTSGTVCPLDISLPIIIDTQATQLDVWSMGAGNIRKGLNVAVEDCLRILSKATIAEIALHNESDANSWYSKGGNSMDPISHLLTRGVDHIYPTPEVLEKVLRSGKKLTLYQGFDPTGTQLHIGHMVGFRKLRQWQDLGHHVIFLIGDGTGLAGDPSGKMKARGRFMSRQELRDNAVSYLKQASKIVRFDGENPIEIKYNGDWLTPLKLEDILNIAQNFTVQQMIERDMYQVRIKAGDPINLREFLYPLLQGYDSVAMKVDLELGGSDQTFNMLAGRTLVKAMVGKEKFVMTVPLLADSKGVKIGKTEGNVIGLTDAPNDFYAKIMSLGDDAIVPCFTLLTDKPIEEIHSIESSMKNGKNPIDFKKLLAFELTKQLNSEKDAVEAQKEFETVHQKGITTDVEAQVIEVKPNEKIIDILVKNNLVPSKSEARRLLEQRAIEIEGNIITNPSEESHIFLLKKTGGVLKIGKKKYVKIKTV